MNDLPIFKPMKLYYSLFSILFLCSCLSETKQVFIDKNPPADGFNILGSDPEAIAIADSVMLASGGRQAWDETTYLKWNFFGSRRHIWNKKTGDLVIEGIRDSFLIKMNLEEMTGEVFMDDRMLTKQDSLDKYLKKGKEMWINDAYWVFLPYKLKDSGVTLKYLEKDSMANGELAERIQLSFQEVGVTPENKYIVYVDPKTNLLKQWDFYTNFDDKKARFTTPWNDYSKHGNLMLSGNRGGDYLISEIAVGDTLSRYFD